MTELRLTISTGTRVEDRAVAPFQACTNPGIVTSLSTSTWRTALAASFQNEVSAGFPTICSTTPPLTAEKSTVQASAQGPPALLP